MISKSQDFIFTQTVFFLCLISAAPAFAEQYADSGSPYVRAEDLKDDQIAHVPTGTLVTPEQLVDTLSGARVVYIGETHDNIEAHRVQLDIIRRLNAKFPGKIAVGMEMFRRSAQDDLNRWTAGNLPEKAFKNLFSKNSSPRYKIYEPIFRYLRENRLPLFGLKSSTAIESRFRREDPVSPNSGFPEIDDSDAYHKAFSSSMLGGSSEHTALGKPYRMLLLWEESMAETVADFLKTDRYRGWTLVVLAGGFHVEHGFGIPKRAFRRVPHAYSIILPTVSEVPHELKNREMTVEKVAIPLYAGDFIWKIPYKVAEQNRVKLGVMLEDSEAGARAQSVSADSNAQRAGIQTGDVILQMDGKHLESVEDLIDSLGAKNPGDRAMLKLRRNGTDTDVEVIFSK